MFKHLMIAVLVSGVAGPAVAETFEDCIAPAIELRSEGLVTFQNGVAELLAAEAPHLESLAGDARDAQLAMHRERLRRVLYMLETVPEEVKGAATLGEVMNMRAAPEELDALRAADPDYGKLELAREAALEKTEGAKGMDELREIMRSKVASSPAFDRLMERATEMQARAAEMFLTCLSE